MRKLLLLLCLSLPALAQQQTIGSQSVFPIQSSATSLVAAADTVTLALSGQQWASAVWVVSTAGSGGITAEYTNDPRGTASTNWLAAPQSKRLDQTTANPSTATWTNATPVAGTYETPLPGNATGFRVRYQTAGTSTVITIQAGAAFTPGVPVVATLFDTTSAVNTAIDTGVLNTDGWVSANVFYVTPAGGSGAIKVVDDAGVAVTMHTVPASATTMIPLVIGGPSSVTAVATSGTIPIGLFTRRLQFTSAQVAALTSRIRIEVRR